jgi:hypothetical protein
LQPGRRNSGQSEPQLHISEHDVAMGGSQVIRIAFFDTAQLLPAKVSISCASVKPDRSCVLPDAVLMVILA